MGKAKDTLSLNCPRCGEGQLFESKNPYKWGKMLKMNTECESCGLKYEKGVGFYYGAMYISYAINIALFVIVTVAYFTYFEDKVDWRYYMGTYLLSIVLLSPVIYRLSRSIWLSIYTPFEPNSKGPF